MENLVKDVGFIITSRFDFCLFFPQTKKGPPVKQGDDGAPSAAYCYNCSKKGHFGYVSILICLCPSRLDFHCLVKVFTPFFM